MRNRFIRFILVCLSVMLAASCAKDNASDNGDYTGDGKVLMKVKTMAVSAGVTEMNVAKPICIYVFNSSDKCVALKHIADESVEADFNLEAGTYRIYAVAGADDSNYILPSMDTATPQTVVALKDGQKHTDIMCASETVSLQDDHDAEVTLEMKRKVFKLVSVCVTNVPEDVIDITATLMPLYETVKINGEYSGEQAKENVSVSRVGKTATWKTDCGLFLMPSVGKPVLQFVFTTKKGKKVFTTVGESELTANYKIELNVDYVGVANPSLKCMIKGEEWGETKQWNVTVNSSELVDEENNGDNVETGDAPQAGSVYKGCYVLKSKTEGNKTVVTLITPKTLSQVIFGDADKESVVAAAIAKVAVDEISGWRLPTKDELLWVFNSENKERINNELGKLNFSTFFLGKFLFRDDDGAIKAYNSRTGIVDDIQSTYKYDLRPFVTIDFYKE